MSASAAAVCRRRPAFLLAEAVMALFLVGVVMGAFIYMTRTFSDHHAVVIRRTAALLAAESICAHLEAGCPLTPAQLASRWPDLDVSLERLAAPPPWTGFERVVVTVAGATPRGATVRVQVRAFVPAGGGMP